MENITNTRNSASKIVNDLKYVKTEPSSTVISSENTTKQSELISDLTATTSSNVADSNLTDDNQENDAIRKRRLQHFESSQQ